MTPDTSPLPNHCEACGSSHPTSLLLELPVPVNVLESLGLPSAPQHDTRLLCGACLEKSLQGKKLDLLDLVKRAPASVKQGIHAYLAHESEI